MEFAGATIGSAFTLEGYAFFAEAIFLGLYLYGWERLSARAHWLTTIPIALSGLASGVLVVAVNAWMQYPTRVLESGVLRTDPWAPFASPAWLHMALHSALACYVATGFAAAGVYAVALLRGKRDAYHLSGLRIALLVGGVSAFAQPFSGDLSARAVAELQPAKLAAMEALFESQAGAPLLIGGIPDTDEQVVRFGLLIPKGLSLLAHHNPNARVTGLNEVPRSAWPNVLIAHLAFQLMVGAGFALMAVTIWFAFVDRVRKAEWSRMLLGTIAIAAPLAFSHCRQVGW